MSWLLEDFKIIRDDIKIHGNIRKIAVGKEDNCTTGCLLNYPYFKENYRLIAKHLSKQHGLDANKRAIRLINFIENLYWIEEKFMVSI